MTGVKRYGATVLAALIMSAAIMPTERALAASNVDVTVSGVVNSGTCTLAVDKASVTLAAVDVTNTGLTATSQVNPGSFTLTVNACSPGDTGKTPSLNITGTSASDNVLWRDPPDSSAANNAGAAYGFVLGTSTSSVSCQKSGNAVIAGYCILGDAGSVPDETSIPFTIGYARNSSNGAATTGGVRSTLHFAFEYH